MAAERIWSWALVAVVMVLCGCASPVKHATPSGKPEVTIRGVEPGQVSVELLRLGIDAGFSLVHQTANQITLQRKSDNAAHSLLFGTGYDQNVYGRIVFTFFGTGDATRVVADCSMVSNAGSSFERKNDLNQAEASKDVQVFLNNLKRKLEG